MIWLANTGRDHRRGPRPHEPAQVVLIKQFGPRATWAIATLTLVAGFASTIFQPTIAALQDARGWRSSLTIRAVALGVITITFSLLSLAIGVLQLLATRWGLLLHYWVIAKLLINVVASAVLLLYMQSLDQLVLATNRTTQPDTLNALRDPSAVTHAAVTATLLLVATILSVVQTARAHPARPTPTSQFRSRRPQARTTVTASATP